MTTTTEKALLTAGAIAKELGATDTKVKKAIKDLVIQPTEKKGCCNYYSRDALKQIQSHLK